MKIYQFIPIKLKYCNIFSPLNGQVNLNWLYIYAVHLAMVLNIHLDHFGLSYPVLEMNYRDVLFLLNIIKLNDTSLVLNMLDTYI